MLSLFCSSLLAHEAACFHDKHRLSSDLVHLCHVCRNFAPLAGSINGCYFLAINVKLEACCKSAVDLMHTTMTVLSCKILKWEADAMRG